MHRTIKKIPLLIIAMGTALAAAVLLKADILFHTDIARDFLLFEDIATNNPLTLIGARSGGIGGVFHGPLWLYLNMPAYLLTNGDPTLIGWFWFLLVLVAGLAVYWVGRKMFSPSIGLWATALYASCAINYAPVMFNPFGAVLLSPIFFYFLCRYLTKPRLFDLLATLFILGCIIQFQIAFGGPILIITSLLIIYSIVRSRQYAHLLGFGILIIPLSSYLLFELRHDFLQTRAVMSYVANSDRGKDFIWSLFINRRINGFLGDGIGVYLIPRLNVIIAALAVYVGWKVYPTLSKKEKVPYRTLGFLYGGYWMLTFLFKGDILGYYTWQFLPLFLLLLASLVVHRPRLAYIVIASVIVVNMFVSIR
ncbi:MAG: glycosyltransferase family 39 protein, partial [Candidatus Roizmanbacteria bacterium]|nr:glycosyltransferase family 39 protein [Candidatus Roizmanbacteria bacterium]